MCKHWRMIASLALPVTFPSRAGELLLRGARPEDLGALMGLMSDDAVSRSRGDVASAEDTEAYRAALLALIDDPANALLVAELVDGEVASGAAETRVVGTFQLTLIPGMARQGATRLLVEAVRVSSSARSGGIGAALMRWVMGQATQLTGARLVQLTSDVQRLDAHRFYERLGFTGSHVGFKYRVPQD